MPVFLRDNTRVLFVHIPKTGGSTIENLFKNSGYRTQYLDGKMGPDSFNSVRKCTPQHMHAEILTTLFRISAFDAIFTIARNPINRLKSEFLHRCAPGTELDEDRFSEWTRNTFNSYLSNTYIYDNHIRPQNEFHVPGCAVYSFEDGMEAVRADLNQKYGLGLEADIPRIRDSKEKHGTSSSEVSVPDRVRRAAVQFYHQDYATFGYQLPEPSDTLEHHSPSFDAWLAEC